MGDTGIFRTTVTGTAGGSLGALVTVASAFGGGDELEDGRKAAILYECASTVSHKRFSMPSNSARDNKSGGILDARTTSRSILSRRSPRALTEDSVVRRS